MTLAQDRYWVKKYIILRISEILKIYANGIAKILVRISEGMKRRLKVDAAMSNKYINEQIISYLAEGLSKMEEKILSNPRKMMCVEEVWWN
ncbi:MAG: hypothetical protein A3F42_06845 [Gammaproteobacteria bacterium RIFCSPHIGHO2_12_FULL_37_34]|nr:MAG: hypothetical protein A3F42_06845 [Gammaproteobacteria bacterium RIFCSPHIGHO2_12_FULL_37_34]